MSAVAVMASALFGIRTLSQNGCEEFGVDRQTVYSKDGLAINVRPDVLTGSFGVRIGSVLLGDLLGGVKSASPDAQAAMAALPKALTPKSNFVTVKTCNTNPTLATLRMVAPVGETELNKLDLYGWDQSRRIWSWVGGEVDPGTREIMGQVGQMPSALLLVKTNPTQPILSIEMSPLPGNTGGPEFPLPAVIGEVSASGLYLGDMGSIAGDRNRLQAPAGARVVPVIRNWSSSGEVNRRLLRDMLASGSNRDSHIANLVTMLEAGKFTGLEVDYRGLDLKQRDLYTGFIESLARALQSKGKMLTVSIPAPIQVAGKWDVGGYDINAIGHAVNYVKLDLSTNPAALTSDQLNTLLNWSAGHVNRYKLQLVVPAISVQQDAYGRTRLIDIESALMPLGELQPEQDNVLPGAKVRLSWKGNATGMRFDEASQTYRYSHVDSHGIQQNVWINTAASLKRSLERLSTYNVRGITLRGLDAGKNNEDMVQIVNEFIERRLAQTKLAVPELMVSIAGASGTQPSSQRLDGVIEIQAPNDPGDYAIQPAFNTSRAVAVQSRMLRVSKDALPVAPTAMPAAPVNPNVVFELGGHAGGLSHLAQMKSSGMSWIRTTVTGFEMPAGFIKEAHANGLHVAVSAMGDRARVLDETYQNEWAQHLGALAAAGVDAIEVWDEPNYEGSWPAGRINGATYAGLLKKAHTAIKAANPKTLVISGGLVSSEVFGGGCAQNGCDDIMFLAQMAGAGAQNYMDCVGAHYTAGFTAPGATGGSTQYSFRSVYYAPMRDLYYQAFGGAKSVCFTELGFVSPEGFNGSMPRNFTWASNTTLAQHAQWLAESAKLSKESGKVRLLLVWNIDSDLWASGESGDPQAGYAIIRPDGRCPACETLRGVMTSQ